MSDFIVFNLSSFKNLRILKIEKTYWSSLCATHVNGISWGGLEIIWLLSSLIGSTVSLALMALFTAPLTVLFNTTSISLLLTELLNISEGTTEFNNWGGSGIV